jgi:hypothetical protein
MFGYGSGLLCLTPLSKIFQLYHGSQLNHENREMLKKKKQKKKQN